MSMRPTLVAFPEDNAAAPFLGFGLTEVVLQRPNGEDASGLASLAVDPRDKIIEATTGRDVAVDRRKLTQAALDIDFLDTATKAQLERVYHDGRPLYFCPNVGPATRWSFPLQRSLKDFAGRITLANARTGNAYFWDETERVFRSWSVGEPCLDFNGAWTRYLRTQYGYANKANYPHPTSTNHGWTFLTGTGTFVYTEDFPSPVLRQRTIANQRGVVQVFVNSGSGAIITVTSAATLSTTYAIEASICIAWKGAINVFLNSAGGTAIASELGIVGDGQFRLIKLGGLNTSAEAQAKLLVQFNDSASVKQSAFIGPIMFASYVAASTPDLEDWNDGTAAGDVITASVAKYHGLNEFTFSCFFRWPPLRSGIVSLGADKLAIRKGSTDTIDVFSQGAASPMQFTNVRTVMGAADGWTTGDWIHLVVRGSSAGGICLFVNGRAHTLNGTEPWEPADHGTALKIGSAYGDFLAGSGISHVRMDGVAWSDREVVDHYDTYFGRGRPVVEPLFGKVVQVTELELSPRYGSGLVQWVGRAMIQELGPDDQLAGMIRQEGDI